MHAKATEEDKIANNIFRQYVHFTTVRDVAFILRIVEYIFCCKCLCSVIHIFSSILSKSEHLC